MNLRLTLFGPLGLRNLIISPETFESDPKELDIWIQVLIFHFFDLDCAVKVAYLMPQVFLLDPQDLLHALQVLLVILDLLLVLEV